MANNPTHVQFIIVSSLGSPAVEESHILDIEQSTDFPLAVTYSIKDVQDPESSKGSFSKTFSIPATKNNNLILKSLYSDSLYESFLYIEEYSAQIFVDGLLVLEGQFNIKGTVYNNIPKSYECVVFGENYKWVNALSELNLCDVDFSAGAFFGAAPTSVFINKNEIENTWQFNMAGEIIGGVSTHIVYPLLNTGKWNYYDPEDFGAVVTPSDMKPSFYIYNLVKCIFAAQGYTVVSNFFETDWFKRLVSLMPRQEGVLNSGEIVQHSFNYIQSLTTDYKIPLNYNNTGATPDDCSGVIGNTWHGQMTNLVLTTPTADPSGVITTQNITPIFDVESPTNFLALSSNAMPTIAGWNWKCYGSQNLSSNRIPWYWTDACGVSGYVGLNFECVSCDIQNGTSNQSISMSTAVFQAAEVGIYFFNSSVTLEMDNAYEVSNPVAPYDPLMPVGSAANETLRGTGNGGAGFACLYETGSALEGFENISRGTTYVFNSHLIHYKASTERYHIVATESYRRKNSSNPFSPNFYCELYPLPSGGTMKRTLSFSNVQIDVQSTQDKIFIYNEVVCEKRYYLVSSNEENDEVIGLTQMKYRCEDASFSGGLTPPTNELEPIILNSLLPCDYQQLELVNGLTGLFNLFWQSNEATKTVTVEPRDNFFQGISASVDWTNKIDHLADHTNTFIYDALKRNLCFTYENDSSDKFVEERNELRGQICELGSHSLNLGDLYINEDQKIGTSFFTPTYVFYDKTISSESGAYLQPLIPVIHGEYSPIWNALYSYQLPDKISDFGPRILCWYGQQPINQAAGLNFDTSWKWGDNGDNNYTSKFEYPFAGVYCDQDGSIGGSVSIGGVSYPNPSLNYEDSYVNAIPQGTLGAFEKNTGLYTMFWERNILGMLTRPKIKTMYVKLTPVDIANLNYRQLIYIQSEQSDTYWILNKIIDYKVGSNELTKVELYEYSNTRQVKASFPDIDTGTGVNDTGQHTDFDAEPVYNGKTKVSTEESQNGLGIYSPTIRPLINVGTQSVSLPILQNLPTIGGKTISTNYFDNATRPPIGGGNNNSSNIGNNHNLNIGSISIGNNQNVLNSNKIIIGDGNNSRSLNSVEVTANGRTAFGVKSDGIFREGGGGVVYFEDASGEIREVMTGVLQGVPYNGIGRQTFYTRLTIGEEK
tara:strand:- start:847 stop:4332 length:3486 start_codon:yes stop_codon:yes gene_type:complete